MKAGDKLRTETLRGLRAGIIEFEKSGADREMNLDDDLKILTTAAKKRREAIELYEQNNRQELADKEKAELAVIQDYLPKQMTREEIGARVDQLIAETGAAGPQDANKVIPTIMKEVKGKADGKMVQEIVKERLAAK
jgi:uncharacterized protein